MAGRDEDGWRELFARHKGALFLMARQYVRTTQEAEDAVQDGFVRFWKMRGAARDAAAYLFTCVRSAALDLRRAKGRREQRENAARVAETMFVDSGESGERVRQIEGVLEKLPEEQREVLVLKIWSGLTFVQIAEALHISANTAGSRYRYAIGALEGLLAKEFRDV